jgi:tetratricopeptide (TPR) repeat protein
MARDRRRLAFAVIAAAALGSVCVLDAHAQAQSKASAKKVAKESAGKESDAQQADAEAAKTPAKKKKQDPAEAQRALESAVKLLEAGKSEQALQVLSQVLAGGSLPPAIMAKAMLYRGIAYRQQKKPAQAIADLTSALWLKGGLSEADRADAFKQRAAAYQEAGLTEGGQAKVIAAVPHASQTRERTASVAPNWTTGTASAPSSAAAEASSPPAGQSNGGWNLFGNLFGGSSTAAPSAPQTTASIQPSEAAPATAPPEKRARATSAWSRRTEVHSGGGPVVATALPAKTEGRFRVQLANVRSQEEAKAMVVKVKREHASLLASREPEIDQAVVGNMGSFYRVRIGPYASQQEGQAVCAKLKGGGFDCLVVTQ